jgi:hypothetical protein
MQFKTFTDANSREIPRMQGIYAFFLDLVSPSKIGLAGRGPWEPGTLEKSKAALIRRVERQLSICNLAELSGSMAECEKSGPLQITYLISAKKQSRFSPVELDQLPLECVREYAEILHDTAIFSQPIYVGITYEQTLIERYEQHRSAFYLPSSESGFGSRFRQMEVDWDDLVFACKPLPQPSSNTISLRKAERHLHSLTNPICSLK